MSRFEKIAKLKSDNFIPAISVHAPYSTRSELAKKAAKFAKDNSLILSTHFLESEYEKQWLFNGNGEFKEWLSFFDKNIRPFYDGYEFIEYFESVRTLFTHCVYVDDFGVFDPSLHSVTTCGVSNRLISKPLNLSAVLDSGLSLNIGTDGLSSNISLNFFDELRANLLIHSEIDLPNLAKTLLLASTLSGAKALGLENGSLEAGKLADIAVFKGFEVCDEDQIALELILQTKESETIFIGGKEWKL